MAKIKYAVVDHSKLFHRLMKLNINSGSVGSFFFDSAEFGQANPKKYDIIFLGKVGRSLDKEDMAKALSKKTEAIIILIIEDNEVLSEEAINNAEFRIVRKSSFFEKTDAQTFLDPVFSKLDNKRSFEKINKFMAAVGEEIISFPK